MIARCALLVLLAAAATACPGRCGGYGRPPVFPVALDNCGPAARPLPVIASSRVAPVVDKGVIPLPAYIPPPKTINNVCRCVKTVVKPQVFQQLLSVPAVQRYLQTSHAPVVENIQYEAIPINCAPYAPEYPAYLPGLPALPALSALAALPARLPALPPFAPAFAPACAPALPPFLPPLAAPCAPALPPFLPPLAAPCAPALPPFLPPALPPCAPAFPRCY